MGPSVTAAAPDGITLGCLNAIDLGLPMALSNAPRVVAQQTTNQAKKRLGVGKRLASASRTACRVIALPRKLALYMHTAAASEGFKNTEDVLQKEEAIGVFLAAARNFVLRQQVSDMRSIIPSFCGDLKSALNGEIGSAMKD